MQTTEEARCDTQSGINFRWDEAGKDIVTEVFIAFQCVCIKLDFWAGWGQGLVRVLDEDKCVYREPLFSCVSLLP